jgi:hypothetical protein
VILLQLFQQYLGRKAAIREGKTSTGWFFGFKLHLVINQLGQIVKFAIKLGNIDDRSIVSKLSNGLKESFMEGITTRLWLLKSER